MGARKIIRNGLCYCVEEIKASAKKEFLRSSVQNACRKGKLAYRYDRVTPLTP